MKVQELLTMSHVSFVLLVVIGVLCSTTIARCPPKCPKNQEWTECGTACPLKCNMPPPDICPLLCKIGCQCKEGYLLNCKGDCVRPSQC